jgi:hypothetical protein
VELDDNGLIALACLSAHARDTNSARNVLVGIGEWSGSDFITDRVQENADTIDAARALIQKHKTEICPGSQDRDVDADLLLDSSLIKDSNGKDTVLWLIRVYCN